MQSFFIARLEDNRITLTAYPSVRHLKRALRKSKAEGTHENIIDCGLLTVGVLSKYFITHHTFKRDSLSGAEARSKQVEKVWNTYRGKYISKEALKHESLEDIEISKQRGPNWAKDNLDRIIKNFKKLKEGGL